MTTTVSPENHATPATLDGTELYELLGLYLGKVFDVEPEDAISQLLKPEIAELSSLGEKAELEIAVMLITDCTVRASAAAMNEPPREAIAQIAELFSRLREDLRKDVIASARRSAGLTRD